jgi:hypothetical protein
VVTQSGYTVPYQLHCWTQLELVDEELIDDGVDDLDDEETDDGTDEGVDDLDDEAIEEGAEDASPQREPFRLGRSNAPPFLFNWKPKLAD